ncbi:MAG: A/G-specific adenine glycosylase, partial [Flavobacteriaceae bacterium]
MSWQKQLLDWYEVYKRDFPWRKTKDPYHIWLSEVIMQQT